MAKKKKKEDKKLKKEAKAYMIEENLNRYMKRLSAEQLEVVNKYVAECIDGDKKTKNYIKELTDEKEKLLIRELIDVSNGKIQVKAIGVKDLSGLRKRQYLFFKSRKPEKQYKKYEPITPSYSDKQPDNQPAQPEPQYMEPDYDDPEPIKIDERLLEEFREEIEKYLNN